MCLRLGATQLPCNGMPTCHSELVLCRMTEEAQRRYGYGPETLQEVPAAEKVWPLSLPLAGRSAIRLGMCVPYLLAAVLHECDS